MTLVKCACGCGQLREYKDKRGRSRRYILGHQFTGKTHTPESRVKIKKSKMYVSKETRKKMSIAKKKMSAETREKLSIIAKARKPSKETRDKLSIAGMGRLCSIETRMKLSISNGGEMGSGWKGGISFAPYCQKFNNSLKERVRDFFGRQCFECGKSELQNGVKLAVHHVNYEKMSCCNDIEPLFVPLCKSCHSKTNHNREYWQNRFEDELVKRTGGKCYYTVEEYKNF